MQRRRKLLAILAGALVLPAAAIAAWVSFTIGGSGGGTFGTASAGAITFTPDTGSIVNACQPGADCDLGVFVQNSTATPGHLLTLSVTSASSPAPGCSLSASSFTVNPSVVGTLLPAGGPSPIVITNALKLDAATPVACAGSTFTVGVSGTAGP